MNLNSLRPKFLPLVVLGALLVFGPCLPAGAETPSGADQKAEVKIPTAEQDPLAVVKEGFFGGIIDGRVRLHDMTSGKITSYRLEEDYLIFQDELEITLDDIPPHSIVKLVLIEGQVREILLLLRSS